MLGCTTSPFLLEIVYLGASPGIDEKSGEPEWKPPFGEGVEKLAPLL